MNLPLKNILRALGAYVAVRSAARRWQQSRYSLDNRVVLITGGSRGLGLVLAREYAARGSKLVLVARDQETLEKARQELADAKADVLAISCDVGNEADVAAMVASAIERFGRIDVVVNVAGQIEVGPVQSMTVADFKAMMDTNFWGAFNVLNAALPHLKPRESRIVNVSSIGGLISLPHLLSYSASKFALTGFSLGLRTELAQKQIPVVTVCPGLMRTGSPANAKFKGDHSAEFAWFSVADSLPLLSMKAERAARAIVRASQRGDILLVLGMPAKLAALANGLFPAGVARASSVVARLLPRSVDTETRRGAVIDRTAPGWLLAASDRAAMQNNEVG
jgi:NAD(P)-dependent dehydrogenase (short-subunit alcohol dehydrogenase family)